MDKFFNEGDSTTMDEGNGNADDFFNAPEPTDNTPKEKIEIESEIPKATLPDTFKLKKGDDKKSVPPPQKPVVDKSKKTEKPKTNNDY